VQFNWLLVLILLAMQSQMNVRRRAQGKQNLQSSWLHAKSAMWKSWNHLMLKFSEGSGKNNNEGDFGE